MSESAFIFGMKDCSRQRINRAEGVLTQFLYWIMGATGQIVLTSCVMCS